jgi:hypothetical protein
MMSQPSPYLFFAARRRRENRNPLGNGAEQLSARFAADPSLQRIELANEGDLGEFRPGTLFITRRHIPRFSVLIEDGDLLAEDIIHEREGVLARAGLSVYANAKHPRLVVDRYPQRAQRRRRRLIRFELNPSFRFRRHADGTVDVLSCLTSGNAVLNQDSSG